MLALSFLTVTVVGAVAHWKGQRDALIRHPGSSASLSSLDPATREDSRGAQTPDPDRYSQSSCPQLCSVTVLVRPRIWSTQTWALLRSKHALHLTLVRLSLSERAFTLMPGSQW